MNHIGWLILAVATSYLAIRLYWANATPWIVELFRGLGGLLLQIFLTSLIVFFIFNFLMSFADPVEYQQEHPTDKNLGEGKAR